MRAADSNIYSLSADMAKLLREASEKPEGKYVPIMGIGYGEPDKLVAAGLAEYKEIHQISDTSRSIKDPRPCEWDDVYLVPTKAGLDMLRKYLNKCSVRSK